MNRALDGLSISFSAPESTPELTLDTSTVQEWILRDPVKLGSAQVPLYVTAYSYESRKIRLVFPVSEEQPISYVEMESPHLLRLPLTFTTREGNQTLGYLTEAELESL